MSASLRTTVALICRWLGRLLSLLLLLFWGAFFVEHVKEWLLNPAGSPPLFVWVSMLFHLGMLVGLALMLFREIPGMIVLSMATLAFFSSIGMNEFPWIALLNVIPIVPFLVAHWFDQPALGPQPRPV